jgi:diketogulonate reductase-like aldo/keto reductase
VTIQAVRTALDCGYRHIDTAAIYGNEKSVGKAIRESGISRKDLFVTSKLFNTEHTYKKTKVAFEKTLNDLQLDYLDLYLIHWPNPVNYRDRWAESNTETWKIFEENYSAGRIKAVGVSNFHAHHLDALEKTASIMPMVNQIRLCPGDTKDEVVKTSRAKNILVEAYSPFGGSGSENVLASSLLETLSKKYGRAASQICIRWCLQKNFLPLPKSVSADHIAANIKVFDFELTNEDIKTLDNLSGYPDPFPHPDHITW